MVLVFRLPVKCISIHFLQVKSCWEVLLFLSKFQRTNLYIWQSQTPTCQTVYVGGIKRKPTFAMQLKSQFVSLMLAGSVFEVFFTIWQIHISIWQMLTIIGWPMNFTSIFFMQENNEVGCFAHRKQVYSFGSLRHPPAK